MKRLLMLSALLSVVALQAVSPGEGNRAMPRRPRRAGGVTSGTIASDGSVVSGDISDSTASGIASGPTTSGVTARRPAVRARAGVRTATQ